MKTPYHRLQTSTRTNLFKNLSVAAVTVISLPKHPQILVPLNQYLDPQKKCSMTAVLLSSSFPLQPKYHQTSIRRKNYLADVVVVAFDVAVVVVVEGS